MAVAEPVQPLRASPVVRPGNDGHTLGGELVGQVAHQLGFGPVVPQLLRQVVEPAVAGGLHQRFTASGSSWIMWTPQNTQVAETARADRGSTPCCARHDRSSLWVMSKQTTGAEPLRSLGIAVLIASVSTERVGRPVRSFRVADPIWHRHSVTVSACRWATFHSPPSRRYTWVARKV